MTSSTDLPQEQGSIRKRHNTHYVADGSLIFCVENTLYRVPVHQLRTSEHFKNMIDSPELGSRGEGLSDEKPIVLKGITTFEMNNFLTVLSAPLYMQDLSMTWEQWGAALHLATMWSFGGVRSYVLRELEAMIRQEDIHPLDRVDVAMKCSVPGWLLPAYRHLCERKEFLTTEEAGRMPLARAMAICKIREMYRSENPKARSTTGFPIGRRTTEEWIRSDPNFDLLSTTKPDPASSDSSSDSE